MKIDVNIATIIGTAFLMLISIIGFFLSKILTNLENMERTGHEIGKELIRIDSELNKVKQEQLRIQHKIDTYDQNIEAFWKDLGKIIYDNLKPHFDIIKSDIV